MSAINYYPNGRLKAIIDPVGQRTRYRYDEQGNLESVTYADNTTRQYHYEDTRHPHALTGITDQRGVRYASWKYDEQGRATESSHINNTGKVTLDFSVAGQTRVTDSQGRQSIYHTDEINGSAIVTRIDGPGCSSCGNGDVSYEYNDQLQLVRLTEKNGVVIQYTYDEQGRTTEVMQHTAGGEQRLIARYEYAEEGLRPVAVIRPSVNPAGEHRIEISYNAHQQPIAITEYGYRPEADGYQPISRTTKLGYTNGNLTTIDGPRDDVKDLIRLSYDAKQRLTGLTGADGRTLAVERYDEYGRPAQIRSGSQSPIQIEYTDAGQIARVSQHGQSVSYTYTATGQLASITTPEGRTLQIDYDEADRAVGLTGPDGRRITDRIDSEGRLVQRDLLGADGQLIQSLSNLYDAQGRLEASYRNGQLSEQYHYDEADRVSEVSDGAGNITRLDYGPLGQLQALIAPDGSQLGLTYDSKGQPIGLTDPRHNTAMQLKDDFGNIIRESHPDTGVVHYAYDAAGNRIEKTDAEGRVTRYRYDAANRLTEENGPAGIIRRSYEPQSGRLSRIVGAGVTESFAYNKEGQLIAHTRELDGHTFTTEYSYNAQQRLARKVLPDGQVLHYHYYAEGAQKGKLRAITREELFGLRQVVVIGEIDHDKGDGETGYTHGNGIRTRYHWDQSGQLNQISTSQGLQLAYHYDEAGRITGIDLNGSQRIYRYDGWGRLTEAETEKGAYRYEYDRLDNRTEKIYTDEAGVTQSESYRYVEEGKGNRLLSIERASGSVDVTYNASGSPLTGAGLRYEYNADQRPVKVYREEADGRSWLLAEYGYNAFGERIKKVVYSRTKRPVVTYYLYDGHTLTAEADESGAITAQYVYLDDHRAVAKLSGGDVYALHGDHLGTPQMATDEAGATVWSADYAPFGKAEIQTGAITLNLRFPGQYFDAETGTHYNYYRDYDPGTGRYATADPIGLQGGLNLYAYVTNNPLGEMDLLGLCSGRNCGGINQRNKPSPPDTGGLDDSFVHKLSVVVESAIPYLADNARDALQQWLEPGNIMEMAGIMAGMAALQLVPGVNVAVNAVMVGFAWWHFGSAGLQFATEMISIGVDTYKLDPTACDYREQIAALGERFAGAVGLLGEAVGSFFDRGRQFNIKPKDEAWKQRNVKPTEAEMEARDRDIRQRNRAGKTESIETAGTKGNPNPRLNKRPAEPNHVYRVKDRNGVERHEYHTNENGYVTEVISKIDRDSLHSSCRFPSAQCSVGKDGNEGDEGGHMISHVLGGIGERLNVFPQSWKLNRGKGSDWRKMEKHWLKLAQEGKEVRVTMRFKYGDPQNPGRPTEIEVVETVDGKEITYSYKNEAPQ